MKKRINPEDISVLQRLELKKHKLNTMPEEFTAKDYYEMEWMRLHCYFDITVDKAKEIAAKPGRVL